MCLHDEGGRQVRGTKLFRHTQSKAAVQKSVLSMIGNQDRERGTRDPALPWPAGKGRVVEAVV